MSLFDKKICGENLLYSFLSIHNNNAPFYKGFEITSYIDPATIDTSSLLEDINSEGSEQPFILEEGCTHGGFSHITAYDFDDFRFVIKTTKVDSTGIFDLNKNKIGFPSADLCAFNECEIIKRLYEHHCEHIMPLYGYMCVRPKKDNKQRESFYAILMPYKHTLNTDIFKDENAVLEMFHQIALALKELHKMGFLHRDVKIENIFYDSLANGKRTYYLGDFGISKPLDETTGLRSPGIHPNIVKTFSLYEICEQYAFDIWCLAKCIKYTSLSSDTERPYFHTYSEDFRHLINQCLISKKHNLVFTAIDQLLDAIEELKSIRQQERRKEKDAQESNDAGIIGKLIADDGIQDTPIDYSYVRADQYAVDCIETILQIKKAGRKVSAEDLYAIMEKAEKGYQLGNRRCQRILAYCCIYLYFLNESDTFNLYRSLQIIEDGITQEDYKAKTLQGFIKHFTAEKIGNKEKQKADAAALKAWREAAELDYAPAQYLYAKQIKRGHMGSQKDTFQAALFFKSAIENGFYAAIADFRTCMYEILANSYYQTSMPELYESLHNFSQSLDTLSHETPGISFIKTFI